MTTIPGQLRQNSVPTQREPVNSQPVYHTIHTMFHMLTLKNIVHNHLPHFPQADFNFPNCWMVIHVFTIYY